MLFCYVGSVRSPFVTIAFAKTEMAVNVHVLIHSTKSRLEVSDNVKFLFFEVVVKI